MRQLAAGERAGGHAFGVCPHCRLPPPEAEDVAGGSAGASLHEAAKAKDRCGDLGRGLALPPRPTASGRESSPPRACC